MTPMRRQRLGEVAGLVRAAGIEDGPVEPACGEQFDEIAEAAAGADDFGEAVFACGGCGGAVADGEDFEVADSARARRGRRGPAARWRWSGPWRQSRRGRQAGVSVRAHQQGAIARPRYPELQARGGLARVGLGPGDQHSDHGLSELEQFEEV